MQRTVLLATQPSRCDHLAMCAKPLPSSRVALAMARAAQLLQGRRVAPTTKTSSGSANASAFTVSCCRRYMYRRVRGYFHKSQ